jgi:hypothetical protein
LIAEKGIQCCALAALGRRQGLARELSAKGPLAIDRGAFRTRRSGIKSLFSRSMQVL